MVWDKESIKNLRRRLGLTQMELARWLGCRQQTISEWEQGLYAPANAYGRLLAQLRSAAPLTGPTLPLPSSSSGGAVFEVAALRATALAPPPPPLEVELEREYFEFDKGFDPGID